MLPVVGVVVEVGMLAVGIVLGGVVAKWAILTKGGHISIYYFRKAQLDMLAVVGVIPLTCCLLLFLQIRAINY